MTKSEIFKKAHAIAKSTAQAVGNYLIAFSLALKDVYKSLSSSVEDKLIEMGLMVWEKANHKRIYINRSHYEELLGLKITCYKTGNISSAEINGEKISNCKAKAITTEMFVYKPYFDCVKKEFINIPLALTLKI